MARRLWLNLFQDAASRPNSGCKYLREEHVSKVASLLCTSAEGGPDLRDAAVASMHACSLAHEIHNDREYYKDGWESGYPTIDELENSSRNLYEIYKWDACDTVDDRIWDLVWIEREKIVYNMPLSTNFEDLFERPCVVNLSNIYQQQNRSFLAMLLVLLLSEYRTSKHADGGRGDGWSPTRLEHLLFIDRTQHVLGRKSPFGAQTQANWQRAVDMLEDMVGQMRQCGSGLYVP